MRLARGGERHHVQQDGEAGRAFQILLPRATAGPMRKVSRLAVAALELDDLVVSVLRGHRLLAYDAPEAAPLRAADRVITIRRSPTRTTAEQ